MKLLSIGKIRGLQQCTTPRGTFTCLALDHRQNLRRLLGSQAPEGVSDTDLTRFKVEVTAALAETATAVLLDPEYGAAQAIAAGAVPAHVGLVVALEATGYSGDPTARQSCLLPGWSVAKARRMGASMVKLLVYYHPDAPTANEIEAFIQQVADDCLAQDIALMLEPLSYSLDASRKSLPPDERRYVVLETARRLTPLGVDILKAEFPLDATAYPDGASWNEACIAISVASLTPWILLSAAVDYETYLRQVTIACQAGASGVAVGRAVWQEAVNLTGEARAAFLHATARSRLARLTELCATLARPWTDFYDSEVVTADWYKAY